ncbi:hypothetical protein IEQ34_023381 [Dendrobium chrysotoxum]|uniref:Uncharacterized protein n=1 Tax=Dendrobium chrysotoxum TaxID=161865 RepID=A0AAV7FWK6_DENCH|nr:hypothetical protein IEQ34_024969 [Dendrobium chrysotoxum]KAH0447787.1 hypothetical protein IEQ34_023381 [Dendrobium chrysotoxum]
MGLVSNTTPRPPNIRTDPEILQEYHVLVQIILVDDNITAPIAIPKPYMKPKLHTAPIWPQRNVRYVMVRNFSDYKIKSDYRTGLNK